MQTTFYILILYAMYAENILCTNLEVARTMEHVSSAALSVFPPGVLKIIHIIIQCYPVYSMINRIAYNSHYLIRMC